MAEHPGNGESPPAWIPGPSTSHTQYMHAAEADEEPSSSVSSSSTAVSYANLPPSTFAQPAYRNESMYNDNLSGVGGSDQFVDSYNVSRSQSEARQLFQPAESSYGGHHGVLNGDGEVRSVRFGDIRPPTEERYITAHAQPVASSSVSQSGGYPVHQLVVDAENRVVAVQRVISPVVDSTVSQSGQTISYRRRSVANDNGHVTHSSVIFQPTSTSHSFMHTSSVPSYSQSEVSTSGGSPSLGIQGHHHSDNDIGQGHGEAEIVQGYRRTSMGNGGDGMEAAVSSISGSVPEDDDVVPVRIPVKTDRETEQICGEPDTTQDDEDEYQPTGRVYIGTSSSIDEGESIHSSIVSAATRLRASSSNMADSVMEPDHLSSTQMSVNHMRLPLVSTNHLGNLSNSQIPTSAISANQMGVNLSHAPFPVQLTPANQLTNHIAPSEIPNGHMDHSQIVANQIEMQQMSANQMASTSHMTSTLDPQFSQMNYVLDSSVVDTSSTIAEQSGASSLVPSYIEQQDTRLDSTLTEQPQPGTSTSFMRRKSSRIAELMDDQPQWRKAKYEGTSYDPSYLWCEECMTAYEGECPIHKLVPLSDKIVFSRAWASLPQALQIFRLGEQQEIVELGVFAKRVISKYTQFGPFVADLVDSASLQTNNTFPLMVERPTGEVAFFETSDENKCNWMMFVRPATSFCEQNLVAYQHGNDIYFTVTKPIDVKGELKVWYASHYADRWGKEHLEITEEDVQALEEQQCKFQCYECHKRFRTAAAMQKHLAVHDVPGAGEPSSTQGEGEEKTRKKRGAASQKLLRKSLQSAKKIKDLTSTDTAGSAGSYHWKKRSTNIYLNKTLKKYQRRQETEAMRKSVQSMYRKTGKDADSYEWTCTSCDLTFDNSSLLNIHTLTHAAEDVGLDEIHKFSLQGNDGNYQTPNDSDLGNLGGFGSFLPISNTSSISLACPVCHTHFTSKNALIEHASEHGRSKLSSASTSAVNLHRPHKCELCWKAFTTIDRLVKHQLCHGDEESKPMQCQVCFKRFMNNSALSCHLKTHSTSKYYECPICHQGFDQTQAMRDHSLIHANPEGMFNCPHCDKCFSEFLVLKKHVRGFHTNKYYPCNSCDKVFPRPDKLRLHMLRHSSVREFMCDTCGRQFKRKDKLKEHIKRMHSTEREEKDKAKALRPVIKKFIPKVLPTEYHRFIYKCHLCLLGFKRRGMLVNHIAKKHPDVKPDSVPELNLPILKTQRDYYCQYCDKVYKSSSKRKAHILKNHPGAELPQSSRKKMIIEDVPGVPNPTYSQTVGSITTMPHQCVYCHKQYASKAKLLQHQRKKHGGMVPPSERQKRPGPGQELVHQIQQEVASGEGPTIQIVERFDGEGQPHDNAQATDLLTQAMSELTQSLQEFRQNSSGSVPDGTYQLQARIGQGPPTMVQIQTTGNSAGTSTIDLSHLNQALQHFNPNQGSLPIQVQVSGLNQLQIPTSSSQPAGTPGQIVTMDTIASPDSPQQQPSTTTGQATPISFHPINLSGAYIPKSWTNYTYK